MKLDALLPIINTFVKIKYDFWFLTETLHVWYGYKFKYPKENKTTFTL